MNEKKKMLSEDEKFKFHLSFFVVVSVSDAAKVVSSKYTSLPALLDVRAAFGLYIKGWQLN